MSARRTATGESTTRDHVTVVDVLRRAAVVHEATEAYVEPATGGSPRQNLTFAEWDRAAGALSAHLASLGVSKGDVVCLLLPSSIDYAVAYAAALRLGAITAGVNPRLGPDEIAGIVERTRPAATLWDAGLELEVPPHAGRAIERAEAAARARDADAEPPPAVALSRHDPVAVVFTSGTTGRPKGAVFDHANLEAVAAGTDVLSRPQDRRLSPLPFAHVGYMTRLWDEAWSGVTTVVTPTPWRAPEALRILEEERITVGQGVPTQWSLLLALAEFDRADLSALRIAGTGAARVPAALVEEMRRRLGVPVVVRYTSTETSLGTGTRPDDPDEVVATTVGRPVAGVSLRLTDDAGNDVAPGTVGRVRLRSGATMRGYWADAVGRDPAAAVDEGATADVVDSQGFVITGDYGVLRADGNLALAGRDNEMYIRGGYNVYPAEVEEVLASHPAVERVAVVGTPDPVLGEVGVAFVEPVPGTAPGLDDLRNACRGRLADYKAPDAVVVVAALPLTPMMKIDRRALADDAAHAAATRPLRGRARGAGDGDPSGGTGTIASMVTGRTEEQEGGA
jgi:acyl-CoA synthetase (AMP-forming)/AMP-acid ligase II